jgi:hypothetical protein
VSEYFSNGMIALGVLALMVVEGIILTTVFRLTGKGVAPLPLICSLSAGAGLVLALFAALVGASWPWIAAALAGSLAGHVADVYFRWTGRR